MESTIAFAKANGYVLTPFGRKCFVGAINDKTRTRGNLRNGRRLTPPCRAERRIF